MNLRGLADWVGCEAGDAFDDCARLTPTHQRRDALRLLYNGSSGRAEGMEHLTDERYSKVAVPADCRSSVGANSTTIVGLSHLDECVEDVGAGRDRGIF